MHVFKPDFESYFKVLRYELKRLRSDFPWKRELTSIYIGGGTPSVCPPHYLAAFLDLIRKQFSTGLQPIEITIEVSPKSPLSHMAQYMSCGINRFSCGLQSFNNKTLSTLGREHTSAMIDPILQSLLALQGAKVNLDIIYGLEEQSEDDMLNDLKQAINSGVGHISWYELTIEPNTIFAKMRQRKAKSGTIESVMEQGIELLSKKGFEHYEISAFSNGPVCQHNINYWSFGDYIGIGAGAHSKVTLNNETIKRFYNTRYPKDYLHYPTVKTDHLQNEGLDYLICRLRLNRPLCAQEICRALPRTAAHEVIAWIEAAANKYPEMIKKSDQRYSLSKRAMTMTTSLLEDYIEHTT